MINPIRFAKRLAKAQCSEDHRHVPLINYRASPCQVYTDEFCDEICQVVKEEFIDKGVRRRCMVLQKMFQVVQSASDNDSMPHPHDELKDFNSLYEDMEFFDDVCGRPLDNDLATKARKLEMDFFRKK